MKSVIYKIFERLLYVVGASLAGTTSPFDNIELDEGPSYSSIASLYVLFYQCFFFFSPAGWKFPNK